MIFKYITVLFCFISITSFGQVNKDLIRTEVTVHGTSTLHDWVSDVTRMESNADIFMLDGELIDVTNLSIKIKTTDIKSEKGSMMDKNTWKAMKYDKFPYIYVKMQRTSSLVKYNNEYRISGNADVTIAGVTKRLPIQAVGVTGSDGEVVVRGEKSFKMSEFGIVPPVVLMGTLKTGDKVTIKYSVTLPCVDVACQ